MKKTDFPQKISVDFLKPCVFPTYGFFVFHILIIVPALYLPKSLLLLPLSEVPRDAGLDVVERWGRCAFVFVLCGVRVGVLVCGRSLL